MAASRESSVTGGGPIRWHREPSENGNEANTKEQTTQQGDAVQAHAHTNGARPADTAPPATVPRPQQLNFGIDAGARRADEARHVSGRSSGTTPRPTDKQLQLPPAQPNIQLAKTLMHPSDSKLPPFYSAEADADAEDGAASEVSFSASPVKFWRRCGIWGAVLSALVLIGLIVAAVLIGLFVHERLKENELETFRDKLNLLCVERANMLRTIMSGAVAAMQGVSGFGRLSLRNQASGSVETPVGSAAFPLNGNPGQTLDAEARAYQNATIKRSLLRQSDFRDFFKYSAAAQYLDRIIWLPHVRNESRRQWEEDTGIIIKDSFTGAGFDERPWNFDRYFPWQFFILGNGAHIPDFIGLDMRIPVLKDIYEDVVRAVETGQLFISFRAGDEHADKDEFGKLNYPIYVELPVYATESDSSLLSDPMRLLANEVISAADVNTTAARWDNLLGMVYASVRMSSVMNRTLEALQRLPMQVDLNDLDPLKPGTEFITRGNPMNPNTTVFADTVAVVPLTLANHRYTLTCTPTQEYVDETYTSTPLLLGLGAGGIVLVNFLLLLAAVVGTGWYRAQHRSRQLAEANKAKQQAMLTLEAARAESDSANRSKSEFLGFLCHELRNPLHAIGSMVDFMHASETLQHAADKEDLECLATIDAQVKVMNVIVNDALDLSKIEAGRMTFETIGFNMGRLLKAVVTSLKSQSISKGITLTLQIDSELPTTAWGDPTRIRQVVMNLLTNALKFTNVGGVVVRARSFPADDWLASRPSRSGTRRSRPPPLTDISRVAQKSSAAESSLTRGRRSAAVVSKRDGHSGQKAEQLSHSRAAPAAAVLPPESSRSEKQQSSSKGRKGANVVFGVSKPPADAVAIDIVDPQVTQVEMATVPPPPPPGPSYVGFEISVEDTGCGISEENLQHLFKPFSQATLSVARKFGGTGLGLSIVKQIVELMGGTITVSSTVYVGTTITIRFLLQVLQPAAGDSSNTNTSSRSTHGSGTSGEGTPGTTTRRAGYRAGSQPPPSDRQGTSSSKLLDDSPGVRATPAPVGLPVKGRATPYARTRRLGASKDSSVEARGEDASAGAVAPLLAPSATPGGVNGADSPRSPDSSAADEKADRMQELLDAVTAAQERVEQLSLTPEQGTRRAEVGGILGAVVAEEFAAHAGQGATSQLASSTLQGGSSVASLVSQSSSSSIAASPSDADAHGAGTPFQSPSGPLLPTKQPSSSATPTIVASSMFGTLWDQAQDGENTAGGEQVATAVAAPPPQPRMIATALVVDDSVTNVKILQKILAGLGCDSVLAYDGQQAIDAVEARAAAAAAGSGMRSANGSPAPAMIPSPTSTPPSPQFDLIMSDILMPVMDGLDMIRAIRSFERTRGLPAVPAVALTANAMAHDQQNCYAAGFTQFCPKPFSRVQISELLHKLMPDRFASLGKSKKKRGEKNDGAAAAASAAIKSDDSHALPAAAART